MVHVKTSRESQDSSSSAGPSGPNDDANYQAWLEEKQELEAQAAAGELDMGQCDTPDYSDEPTCLYKLAATVGIYINESTTRVVDIPEYQREELRKCVDKYKVYYVHYTANDERNHVQCIQRQAKAGRLEYVGVKMNGSATGLATHAITSFDNFFVNNIANPVRNVRFFAAGDDGEFGADLESIGRPVTRTDGRSRQPTSSHRSASVVDESASHGGANTGGVTRAARRVVGAKTAFTPGGVVAKKYIASKGLMFNNLKEMYQDMVSREYAQEILESVFDSWRIPLAEPDATKYAEDLVWAFIIATTASNKANYDRAFMVPTSKGEIEVNFKVLSDTLESVYGVTRRQFARGVSDDMWTYLKLPENVHILPGLATRAGCDPQMATLVFDGSTHATGMVSSQITFTKLLESRNLFEDDTVIAEGASARLMQGVSSGVRAKVQR